MIAEKELLDCNFQYLQHEALLHRNKHTIYHTAAPFFVWKRSLTNNLPKGTWRHSWFSSLNSASIYYCSPFHFPFTCTLFQVGKNNKNDKTDVLWMQSLHALETVMLLLLDSCSSPMLTRYQQLTCFARPVLMQEFFLHTTAFSKPVKCLQHYLIVSLALK